MWHQCQNVTERQGRLENKPEYKSLSSTAPKAYIKVLLGTANIKGG